MPKFASAVTSVSATRALVSADAPPVDFDARSSVRSGRRYASPAISEGSNSDGCVSSHRCSGSATSGRGLDGLLGEVRVVVDAVDQRPWWRASRLQWDDLGEGGLLLAGGGTATDALHGAVRTPDDGADGGARQQQQPGEQREGAEDEDACGADQPGERGFEATPRVAAVGIPEDEQQAGRGDDEPDAERTHVHELAAHQGQRSDADHRDREHVDGRADERFEAVGQAAADDAGAPASVQDGAEEQAEGDECEPDQLGVVMAARPRGLLLPAANARRRLRAQLGRTLLARHGGEFVDRRALPA